MSVLAYINTRGRYETTLPLAINSVIMQAVKPDKFILFDDNDKPEDLRERLLYRHLFQMLTDNGIKWAVIYGQRKGQHFNHQTANLMDYDWCWRLDDDCVAEPNVLETLLRGALKGVGAIGGSILTPPVAKEPGGSSKITELHLPNKQWFPIKTVEEVDHLHCSYLYRAGAADYDLDLSPVAHREETLHTFRLKCTGYKNYIVPCTTWHLRADGGIRSHPHPEYYEHDEQLFAQKMKLLGAVLPNTKYVVLDSGMGDHYAFLNILPELQAKYDNVVVAACYPEVFDGCNVRLISIAEASLMLGGLTRYNIYKWMAEHKWNKQIKEAYKEMYL